MNVVSSITCTVHVIYRTAVQMFRVFHTTYNTVLGTKRGETGFLQTSDIISTLVSDIPK